MFRRFFSMKKKKKNKISNSRKIPNSINNKTNKIEKIDENGNNLLINLIYDDNTTKAFNIIQKGDYDYSYYNKYKFTALSVAISNNNELIAMELLKTGKSNPGIVDFYGDTALLNAIKNNMYNVALKILHTGESNPFIIDQDGKTALDYLTEINNSANNDITQLISELKVKNNNETSYKNGKISLFLSLHGSLMTNKNGTYKYIKLPIHNLKSLKILRFGEDNFPNCCSLEEETTRFKYIKLNNQLKNKKQLFADSLEFSKHTYYLNNNNESIHNLLSSKNENYKNALYRHIHRVRNPLNYINEQNYIANKKTNEANNTSVNIINKSYTLPITDSIKYFIGVLYDSFNKYTFDTSNVSTDDKMKEYETFRLPNNFKNEYENDYEYNFTLNDLIHHLLNLGYSDICIYDMTCNTNLCLNNNFNPI